ncbi:MAG: nitroreductase family protein [Rectinemataceae bacterium]
MTLPDFSELATSLIAKRYSCRAFAPPDEASFAAYTELRAFVASLGAGPLSGRPRFELVTSEPGDSTALKGLGTYGLIRNPSAFLAVVQPKGVEILDIGWNTELVVLKATELGLGSCWLGGTFRRGRFAKAAQVGKGERIAIVVALGKPAPDAADHAICRRVGGNGRKAWNEIFYDGDFERPIASPAALVGLGLDSSWADALEALRLAPSASNKQPWALARSGGAWELYLRRNPGYYPALARRIGFADMQLNDMGIAMVHLSLAARERGLAGGWKLADGAQSPLSWPKGAEETRPMLVGRFE